MRECDTRKRFNVSSFVDNFFFYKKRNNKRDTHIFGLKSCIQTFAWAKKNMKIKSALRRKKFMYNSNCGKFMLTNKVIVEKKTIFTSKTNTWYTNDD